MVLQDIDTNISEYVDALSKLRNKYPDDFLQLHEYAINLLFACLAIKETLARK